MTVNQQKKVWVIGNGQLGMMLRHAAQPLAVDVQPIGAEDHTLKIQDLTVNDVVTPEIEAWQRTKITETLAAHPHFINRDVFPIIADRKTQKETLDQLNVATAKWCEVTDATKAETLYAQLGERVLLKRRRGGYDGRGQYWLKQREGTEIPFDFKGSKEIEAAIAEEAIPFVAEVSVIGVRTQSGETQFYPLSQNHHVNGILKATIGAAPKYVSLQAKAEEMLSTVMQHFNYVGVMAMECFVVEKSGELELLVNELAPRVHNSGHWTQAGMSISQFEAHVRAVADLPMARFRTKGMTVMINLVGVDYDPRWLDIAGVELFWYQKEVRSGRKVGHINILTPCDSILKKLANLLPDDQQVFDWVFSQIED